MGAVLSVFVLRVLELLISRHVLLSCCVPSWKGSQNFSLRWHSEEARRLFEIHKRRLLLDVASSNNHTPCQFVFMNILLQKFAFDILTICFKIQKA